VLVCDGYHGNVEDTEPDARTVETVSLTRDDARRGRVRATTETGREIGVALDRRLRDGDIVHDGDVAVVVRLETVDACAVELGALTPEEAASLGHELGNAHHEMATEDGVAYVPENEETVSLLRGSDAGFRRVDVEPSLFDADDAPHGHSHDGEGGGGHGD
jgi:urease accessory protein